MRRLFPVVALFAQLSFAGGRAYPLAWDSAVLAPGKTELQLWVTPHFARKEAYTRHEGRLGFSLGVTDRLEMLTAVDVDLEFTGAAGVETGQRVEPRVTSLWRFVFSKNTEGLGLSALARVSLGLDVAQFEGRMIFDKRIGNGQLTVNSSLERSAFWSDRTGVDTRMEQLLSARYLLGENFSTGFEFLTHSSWKGLDYQGSGFYLGPTVSFTSTSVWAAFGFYAQVASDKAFPDRHNDQQLTYRDDERFILRLQLGLVP